MKSPKKFEGWFWHSREKLWPIIQDKNELHHFIKNNPGLSYATKSQLQSELKKKQRHVKDQVKLTKARYYAHLAEMVHDMPYNPRLA